MPKRCPRVLGTRVQTTWSKASKHKDIGWSSFFRQKSCCTQSGRAHIETYREEDTTFRRSAVKEIASPRWQATPRQSAQKRWKRNICHNKAVADPHQKKFNCYIWKNFILILGGESCRVSRQLCFSIYFLGLNPWLSSEDIKSILLISLVFYFCPFSARGVTLLAKVRNVRYYRRLPRAEIGCHLQELRSGWWQRRNNMMKPGHKRAITGAAVRPRIQVSFWGKWDNAASTKKPLLNKMHEGGTIFGTLQRRNW